MAHEHSVHRYRSWYAKMIRFYPRPYQERFGEGMEQTFGDLLCERAEEKKELFSFALWMFAETFMGIIKENVTRTSMKNKNIVGVFAVTAAILMIPLVAMQFTSEVDWDLTDFIIMGILLVGTGLMIVFAARKVTSIKKRAIVIVALLVAFLLIWADLAVGIFNIPGISGS